VLFESTGAYRSCIDSSFCNPFAAAVSIPQENPNPLCERGASLKRNLVIAGNSGMGMSATVALYAALSIQSYLFFLGESHFGNIYIYNKLIAYVTRKNNLPDLSVGFCRESRVEGKIFYSQAVCMSSAVEIL